MFGSSCGATREAKTSDCDTAAFVPRTECLSSRTVSVVAYKRLSSRTSVCRRVVQPAERAGCFSLTNEFSTSCHSTRKIPSNGCAADNDGDLRWLETR